MATSVKKHNYQAVTIQKHDGSIWSGYIGPGGHMYFDKQVSVGRRPLLVAIPSKGASPPTDEGEEELAASTPPKPTDKTFLERLRSVLKDNNTLRVSRHRLRGKLDLKALTRVETDRQDVFKHKGTQGLNYSILVLVDESGSMCEQKFNEETDDYEGPQKRHVAGEVVRFLGEHLAKAEGIRFSVIGFNHTNKVYKTFDGTCDYAELEQGIIARSNGPNASCNHDQHAVQAAFEALRKEDDKTKKILLYLSDGAPAGCIGDNDHQVIANDIRSATDITTIGIGILYEPMQIPYHITVDDLADLKPKILNALKAQIKRGEL